MSNLIRSVAIQHLRHQFKLFLHRFYDKLYILQPEIYVVSNFTKDAVHLQVTWKSISMHDYVTYNTCTTYRSDYLSAINQICQICTYALVRCLNISRLTLCRCVPWDATSTTKH